MATYDGFDVVAPKELIVPVVSGASTAQPVMSGALYVSGAGLYINIASAVKRVTLT